MSAMVRSEQGAVNEKQLPFSAKRFPFSAFFRVLWY